MEFDKSKVYTALNADELKLGSKVICANTLDSLRYKVRDENEITEVKEILKGDNERRFRTEFKGTWPLIYLVSEPEEKKLKWTDLKIGDIVTNGIRTYMVTGIDSNGKYGCHILFGTQWITDGDLRDWEKVE